jgi:hypothetical protein
VSGETIGSSSKSFLRPTAFAWRARSFAASCAKAQGYSLEQLKAGLAHTTITTTEGYVQRHTTPVSEIVLTLPPRRQRSKNSE